MRYSNALADSLLRRLAREYGAPVSPFKPGSHGFSFQPGAFVLNKGSATYGIAWSVALITSEHGAENTIAYAETFDKLVDQVNAIISAATLAQRVRDAVKGSR